MPLWIVSKVVNEATTTQQQQQQQQQQLVVVVICDLVVVFGDVNYVSTTILMTNTLNSEYIQND
jgi:hypothetical protein